jgi:hypothetical protein
MKGGKAGGVDKRGGWQVVVDLQLLGKGPYSGVWTVSRVCVRGWREGTVGESAHLEGLTVGDDRIKEECLAHLMHKQSAAGLMSQGERGRVFILLSHDKQAHVFHSAIPQPDNIPLSLPSNFPLSLTHLPIPPLPLVVAPTAALPSTLILVTAPPFPHRPALL